MSDTDENNTPKEKVNDPTQEELAAELINSYDDDGLTEDEKPCLEDLFATPPNDDLEEDLVEKDIAANMNHDKDLAHIDYSDQGPGNMVKSQDHLVHMLRSVANNGSFLGEVRGMTAETRQDLMEIFVKIRTEYSVDLQLKGNDLYGAPCPMDVEINGYSPAEQFERSRETGSCSAPPKSQLRKPKDKAKPGDYSTFGSASASTSEVADCKNEAKFEKRERGERRKEERKEKGNYTKEKKTESLTSGSKKHQRKERLADILCRFPWLKLEVRSLSPKTLYELIKGERLKPTDPQLEDADSMSKDEFKPLRLAVLMKENLFYETAYKHFKEGYRSEMVEKRQNR